MKKKNIVFKETAPFLAEKYGSDISDRILVYAEEKFSELCDRNSEESKAVKAHTVKDIYPCISIYYGMERMGIDKQEAVSFLDRSYSERAKKNADMMRLLFKIPGLYKLYPAMFRSVAEKQFGEDAGFKADFYDTPKTRTRFDMTECLYCKVCAREGCPELVPCFCHTDDVNNGNLHPKLCWARTQIMGSGGDVCDFDIYVKE